MGEFLLGLLSGGGIILVIVIFFAFNPEKLEKWIAMFLRLFVFITGRVTRHQIKYEIQASINSFIKRLAQDSNVEDVGVKIKWAGKDGDDEVEWHDGEVVLVMKDRGQRNRNFVHAAYLFTSTSLLKNMKTRLSKKQSTAIDLFTTGKILEEENPPSLEYFNKDIANPILEDEKIKALVDQFLDIDKSGYYVHILMQELHYLGTKVIFSGRRGEVYEEVSRLIDFLQRFATREVGDDTISEEFVSKFFHTSIKIVATAATRQSGKTSSQINRVCKAFARGIENVYVIGPYHGGGKEFIDMVCEGVCERSPELVVVRNRTFKGATTHDGITKRTNTYMVQLQNSSGRKFIDDKDVSAEIEKYKQEIADDKTADEEE